MLLVRIYNQQLRFDKALANIRDLLYRDERAKENPEILNLAAWTLLLADLSANLAEAERHAVRACQFRVAPQITNTLALIRMLKGESEQAESLLESISDSKRRVNRETNHPINFFLLAVLSKRRGEQYATDIERFVENTGMLTKEEMFLANELNCETEVIDRSVELDTKNK